jgi:hypothetical protein
MGDELRKYAIEKNARKSWESTTRLYAPDYYDEPAEQTDGSDYSVTVTNSFIESPWNETQTQNTPLSVKLAEYRWRIKNDCCCIL